MTVAQTTQLIQLILNTCLLMTAAVVWWGLAWMRQGAIATQISQLRRRWERGEVSRQTLRSLQQQYRLGRCSVGVMHYVLLGLAANLMALSVRMLLGADWLISLSMLLFVGAVGGLLLSVGLTLMEFSQSAPPARRRPRRSSSPTGSLLSSSPPPLPSSRDSVVG